ncbi:MAG: hypothetical protein QOJ29_1103, partial [Thermoleophilaceae bacterium]|nr:hypothetical protein [Thermoleophilaceae bacterium]
MNATRPAARPQPARETIRGVKRLLGLALALAALPAFAAEAGVDLNDVS